MGKKILAGSMIGSFVFILLATAWDYCQPDPDKLLFRETSTSASLQIKKPHLPCPSLKDAYHHVLLFRVSQPSLRSIGDYLVFPAAHFLPTGDSYAKSGLSPPLENSPPLSIPLFLLNKSLLI